MNIFHTRDFPFDKLGDKPAGELLVHAGTLLEDAGIDYWLSSGTMLGIYRDGGPIKEDTDLDVGVSMETPAKAIRDALKGYELVQIAVHCGKIQQVVFMYEDVIFDVCFYDQVNGVYENWNQYGLMRKPCELIDQRGTVIFQEHEFSCPKAPDYLEWRYGEDWETPKGNEFDWAGVQRV